MPARRCTACQAEAEQEELIRLVALEGHGLSVDLRGKLPGRGGYACPKVSCLSRALAGAASRSLKQRVRVERPAERVQAVESGLTQLVREGLSLLARRQLLSVGLSETLQAASGGPIVAALNCSERTRKMVDQSNRSVYALGTQEELGIWLGRGPTGVLGLPAGPAGRRLVHDLARVVTLRASLSA